MFIFMKLIRVAVGFSITKANYHEYTSAILLAGHRHQEKLVDEQVFTV